jgi:L-ascorbate metabolism protein UlaG (beta-lactamase superfamily)
MDASIRFRWLGVGGIELAVNGQTLLVDPFFTRPPFWRMWIGRVRPNRALTAGLVNRCEACLITHAHWDHLMDVPDVVRTTGAVAFGSANACRLLAVCGVAPSHIQEIRSGERLALGAFDVDVFPSEHIWTPGFSSGPLPEGLRSPLRIQDYRMDRCYSFCIHADGRKLLYWSGRHAVLPVPAEVLFVGPFDTPAYYRALLSAVQPRMVIPVHWDDLFRPLCRPVRPSLRPPRWAFPPLGRINLRAFQRQIAQIAPEVTTLVPEMFRTYDLAGLL